MDLYMHMPQVANVSNLSASVSCLQIMPYMRSISILEDFQQ